MARPKPNADWVGRTLGDRYKIEAFIDQGGMSAVYKAYDPNLQRTVAVKLIHHHLSNDPQFVRRFEQEAASVAKLRHPNIVQVYDFNHDDNVYYMVMEYVPGQTLKEKLKKLSTTHQYMPLADVIRIMANICEAVAYAHEQGMVHRDLKPANVMLTPEGQVVLMDFGVAKMLSGTDETATGAIIGTAKYMSPEQARGGRPDERSDIYALGVMLYEMVAGQPPFDADTTVPILLKHVNEPIPDIRRIQKDAPDSLVEIIERALAKNPDDRYQAAAHMAVALKLIERLGQVSTPVSDSQRTVSSKKRQSGKDTSSVINPASTVLASSRPSTPPAETPAPVKKASNLKYWIGGAVLVALILVVGAAGLLAYLFGPSLGGARATGNEANPNLPSSEGMVRIGAAVYTVGLDTPDRDHAPKQNVELSEYWIDQHEVTNAQYAKFLAETDQPPPPTWSSGTFPDKEDDFPVMGITWDQAKAYCESVHKRLPTEAEWEIAARGPEDRLYPWGDNKQAVTLPRSGAYKVGSKLTNQSPFGVFDMAGNVWEWVDKPYAPVPEGQRVLRGGTNDFLKDMAYRLAGDPSIPTMSASAGIRCAADKVNVVEENPITDKNVYYEDSFTNPGSGWPILSEGAFFFGYHPPDFYHVEIGTPDKHTAVSHPPNFDNATVITNVLVDHTTTEDGDFRYGLVLRRTAEDQYYAFTISPRTKTWYILKSSAAGLEVLKQGPVAGALQGLAPHGITPDKTDKLQVDANGADFTFHINEQVVAQVSDSDYASGEIGFYVETFDETLAHIHYDELTIRQVETQVPDHAVLEEDQFTDPASGWPSEDVEGEPFRFGYHPPDFYHVEPRAANEHTVVTRPPNFDNATVETNVLVDHTTTEDGDFRYGLVLRRTAEDQYYAFTVSPRQDVWQVLKSSPTGIKTLAEGQVKTLRGIAPAGITPDKTDKLRVDALDSTFAFEINGEPVVQVSDSEYADGEVGFYVENFDETLTHIHYDSLIIEQVDADAISRAPTVEPTPPPPTATPTPKPTATPTTEPTAEPTPEAVVEPPEGMVLVPAGYFLMGNKNGPPVERPEHPVFLDAFFLDQHEVTNAQYRTCVRQLGCTQGRPESTTRSDYRDSVAYDDYPVINITWDQADAYCKWAGKQLPSEAQWEYAASGPDNLTWPWGNTFDPTRLPATADDTQPVGSYPDGVSPFGIFDMAGNVNEWVGDDFDENFYEESPPSNPVSTGVSAGRLYRGGSFGSTNGTLYTTSHRYGNVRTFSDAVLGFRCAQDAPKLTSTEERAALIADFCQVYTAYKPGALCP